MVWLNTKNKTKKYYIMMLRFRFLGDFKKYIACIVFQKGVVRIGCGIKISFIQWDFRKATGEQIFVSLGTFWRRIALPLTVWENVVAPTGDARPVTMREQRGKRKHLIGSHPQVFQWWKSEFFLIEISNDLTNCRRISCKYVRLRNSPHQ